MTTYGSASYGSGTYGDPTATVVTVPEPDAAKPQVIVPSFDESAIAESHTPAVLVEVLDPITGIVLRDLTGPEGAVIDGSVSLDAGSAARASLDLALVDDGSSELIPTEPDSLLASTSGNELRVSRGIEYPDRIELVRLGVFDISHPTGSSGPEGDQIRITGLDRTGRFIRAKFLEPKNIASGTQAIDAITDLLTTVWPLIETDFIEVDAPLPALAASEQDEVWSLAQGIATVIGCELYFRGDGVCVLRPVPTASQGNPVATITEGSNGVGLASVDPITGKPMDAVATLLSAERDMDRDKLYNHWTVTSESTDEGTATIRAVALDNNPLSPTHFFGPFGQQPNSFSSPYITTADQAQAAAGALLARSLGAPDVVSFGAIVDPARRPSDVVRIRRERLGLDQDHILDQVQIPLGAEAEMTAATRAAQELTG